MNNRVLIAAPFGDGKEYSINEWLNWIATQRHEDYDVAVCVNGKSAETLAEKVELMKKVEIRGRPITVLHLPFDAYHGLLERLTYSREKLRQYAVDEGFDWIFWLDSDTIPAFKDAIHHLLEHKKTVISGLYFYKGTKQPVAIDLETETNFKLEKLQVAVQKDELLPAWGFGYGCVLMHRSVFEAVPFKHYEKNSDDFAHCHAMDEAGVPRWLCPLVICKHYHSEEFTVKK